MAKKIKKGKVLEELVKGSLDYTMQLIREAFRKQFPNDGGMGFYVNEIFADHVIISDWSSSNTLKTDEYWKVTFSKDGDSYVFAARDQWEVVELAYKPQSAVSDQPSAIGEGKNNGRKKGKRFEETIANAIQLTESEEEEKSNGPWRIKATGITADIINGNGRRYPAKVLEAAVKELNGHLHESAAQGRMLSLTGESDHPADKGNRRPLLKETVFNWDKVEFDGKQILLEGNLLGTSNGKDIHAQMRGGVIPGISQRGYGASKSIEESDISIEEVTQLIITGYDGTAPNEQSDPNGSINYFESIQGEFDMNELLEQLKKLLGEHPELFGNGMTEAQLEALNEKQLKKLDEQLRTALGIDANANIIESVKTNAEKARKFDESEKKSAVEKAITEATKELPYGDEGNKMFIEAVKASDPQDEAAVKSLVEAKRVEYDKIFAGRKLQGMGFTGKIQGVQSVLESETGTPEFARPSFELTEAMHNVEYRPRHDLRKPQSANELFTMKLLKRFDQIFESQLKAEYKQWEEAQTTADLNLPYVVSRAIIEEAFPDLIAAGIFDVGTIDASPTRIAYEAFEGETGYTGTVTDEVEAGGAEDTWYALAHGRITPDTVVVTSDPAGTTYEEGVDFVIDYAAGRIKFLTAGAIGANDVLVDYSYIAIRSGEMVPIERAKVGLIFAVIEAAADRLATQISSEAIVFSRSQFGYDDVARKMLNLVKQLRRNIDTGLMYAAFSAVKSLPNNSTDAWTVATTQDALDELVRLMGAAHILVDSRFYPTTFYLMNKVNAERLSHWDGFKRDGFPNAVMAAAGFAGGVNGIPIFAGTEFPGSLVIAGNRELVQHRVFKPMTIKGPYPSYAATGDTTRLVAADQYYAEEYNFTGSFVPGKGAFVPIEEEAS